MARPIVPHKKKKRQVSVSLSPTDCTILDNLCSMRDMHRSALVSELIQGAGWEDLGLAAIDEHIMPVRIQDEHLSYKGACNPKTAKGLCTHPLCVGIYKKEGIR